MPLFGGFGIGRWFGFRVRIDYSWFIIFALVVWTFSSAVFPSRLPGRLPREYVILGVAAALLLFLSVLLHELAHSAVARTRGIKVEGITLFIFGGVAETRMEARRPVDEFLLTVVGPLASMALAGAFFVIAVTADFFAWPASVGAIASYLAPLNLMLAVFNLVPAFPLDGGRLFRSVVWQLTGNLEKATRWATRLGWLFGYALVGFGALLLTRGIHSSVGGLVLDGVWLAFIGWFLAGAARGSYRQFELRRVLSAVPVELVMTRDAVAIPAGTSVQEAIDAYFLRSPHGAYPVIREGQPVGLLSLEAVSEVPAARRSDTTVERVMRPAGEVVTVEAGEMLDVAIERMRPTDHGCALVVRDGSVVGLLSLEDMERWLRRVRRLLVSPGRDVGRVAGRQEAKPGARPGGQSVGEGER